ncbi:MAG: hypothetical protein MZV63_13360 [Marinilabiliales bacterium]|nr:hypothetical protein [Marinilabiliales bacterium]
MLRHAACAAPALVVSALPRRDRSALRPPPPARASAPSRSACAGGPSCSSTTAGPAARDRDPRGRGGHRAAGRRDPADVGPEDERRRPPRPSTAKSPARPASAAIGFPPRHLPPLVASSLPTLRDRRLRRRHLHRQPLRRGRRRQGRHLRRRPPAREVLRLPPVQPGGRALPAGGRPRPRLPLRRRQSRQRGPHRQRRLRPRRRLPRLAAAPRPHDDALRRRATTSTPSSGSCPGRRYFAAHPEYFALMNGKRIIDQPCLSPARGLRRSPSARLREEMAAQPGQDDLVGQPERQLLLLPVPRVPEGHRGGGLAGRARSSASSTGWPRSSRTRPSRPWPTSTRARRRG